MSNAALEQDATAQLFKVISRPEFVQTMQDATISSLNGASLKLAAISVGAHDIAVQHAAGQKFDENMSVANFIGAGVATNDVVYHSKSSAADRYDMAALGHSTLGNNAANIAQDASTTAVVLEGLSKIQYAVSEHANNKEISKAIDMTKLDLKREIVVNKIPEPNLKSSNDPTFSVPKIA